MGSIIKELLFKDECYMIVGLCMKVHAKLGRGFKEIVYKDALEVEFLNDGISYEREKAFKIEYEGIILRHRFDADFFVFNSILLEIKAAISFHPENFRQAINYLKASQVNWEY